MAVQPIKIPITAIDRTKKAFQSVTRSLNVVKKALFNFKVGITAAVGAAGLGLLVKNSLESIDALGKTASKLGIATAELQKLRFASQLAGVETRTVDMAVQRFTRRLAEAANGTGEAKDALKELGIDAASLSRQPLEKQMLALAAAFEKVEGSGDRVRLAFKLFDSEGVAFVNTLQAGEKALKDTFSEVDDLGIILSTNAVKGVESFNDSVVKLTTIFKGLINTVAAGLAGPLQVLVEMLTGKLKNALGEGGKNVRNFTRELGHSIINATEVALKAVMAFINETGRAIDKLRKEFIEFKEFFNIGISVDELGRRMDTFNHFLENQHQVLAMVAKMQGKLPPGYRDIKDAIDPLSDAANMSSDELLRVADALEKAINKQEEGAGASNSLVVAIRDLADGVENVRKPYENLFSEIKIGTGFLDEMRRRLDQNTDAIEGMGDASQKAGKDMSVFLDVSDAARKSIDEMTRTVYGAAVPFHVLQEQFENIDAPLKSANDNIKVTTTSIAMLTEQYEQIDAPIKAVNDNIDKMAMTMRDAKLRGINALEDGLVSLMTGAKSTSEAFKDMARSIIADLARIAIQQSITLPLAQAMGFNVAGARAMGGPMTAGRPYVVGEKGPEVVIPGRNSAVIPNNQIGTGGVTVNQTVHITTGVQQTVRAEVMNMLPDIANATKGAVLDARRRGGSFAAAFG